MAQSLTSMDIPSVACATDAFGEDKGLLICRPGRRYSDCTSARVDAVCGQARSREEKKQPGVCMTADSCMWCPMGNDVMYSTLAGGCLHDIEFSHS